ncbi:MAG: arginyl-transferase family protein, partial [Hyphomicrobium sp.]
GCHACVSVRVVVNEFQTGRNLRRVKDKNRQNHSIRRAPEPTSEQFNLFRRYIDARHADGGMSDMTVLDYAMMVEDSVINTFVTEYREKPENPLEVHQDDWPLKGVALCDMLSDGISMVYSFYDPDVEALSLGTYMIIEHIEYARRLGLPFLYLGYWINGSRKMSYKMRFQPQEHLGPNGWVRRD